MIILDLEFLSKYILYKAKIFKQTPNKITIFNNPLSNIYYNFPKLYHKQEEAVEQH